MLRIRHARVAGIKIRQRRHRQNLAGVDIHHQAGAALGGEIVDNPLQLLPQDVLQTKIEG